MAKKRIVGFVHGTCARCSETTRPLTFYERTKEWLCDADLADAKREIPAQNAIKQSEKKSDVWNEMTSNVPVTDTTIIDT